MGCISAFAVEWRSHVHNTCADDDFSRENYDGAVAAVNVAPSIERSSLMSPGKYDLLGLRSGVAPPENLDFNSCYPNPLRSKSNAQEALRLQDEIHPALKHNVASGSFCAEKGLATQMVWLPCL